MRVATEFDSTAKACECLSLITQVLYLFCQTEVSERACTPPWQLGELHAPGPTYLFGSAAAIAMLIVSRRVAFKNLYSIMNLACPPLQATSSMS